MKKVLITGVSGFVGKYLVDELLQNRGYEIYGTKLSFETRIIDNIVTIDLDLTNSEEVHNIVSKIKPDVIFHLAAQSSVKKSWEDPSLTANINIIGTINLLEEIKISNPKCKIVLVGSSEEYGKGFEEDSSPTESKKCSPQNMYAITKVTQNYIGTLYAKAYKMNIVMTRSFNHFGPGQSPSFVISDFCNQVALIEQDKQNPIIKVGNLSAYRDFLDVRDVVAAYHMLSIDGKVGETYNVGSGTSYKIEDLLNKIISNSEKDIKIELDKSKFRPIDIKETKADIGKLKSDTKWKPKYSIDDTLYETLEYWRNYYSMGSRKSI